MLRVAIGQSEGIHTQRVIDHVLAQCRAQLRGDRPGAGILLASGEFDYAQALRRVAEELPGLALIGGTTRGAMCGPAGYAEDALSLVLFASDTVSMTAGVARDCSGDPARAVRGVLDRARQDLDGPERLCIALPEVARQDTHEVVAALGRELAEGCGLFGGAMGRTWAGKDSAWQFAGTEVMTDALPLLLFSGPIEYAFTVENSWTPVGERQRVTRAAGREVARIGERTALEFYQHYLGEHTHPAIEFPIAVFDGDSENYYVRVPRGYDADTGAVRYSGPVPEGATVQLTEAVRSHMLERTDRAAHRAAAALASTRPAVALTASCGIRRLILGTQVARESEIVGTNIPDVPVFGMYADGEIAPVAPGRPSVLHQATLVTLVVGERDAEVPAWTSPRAAKTPDTAADVEFLSRKLARSERFRAQLEEAHERDHAMLRTINNEIERSRALISRKNEELGRLYAELEKEKQKTEELLLNILPRDVADELKRTGHVEPVYYPSVTVLFTDFKDFTNIAARLTPQDLLRRLDYYFSEFDAIIERHGLEKLKTIGDAYMCAGGIPVASDEHALQAVRAAWDMQELMARAEQRATGQPAWELRIGIHTGPLMAGVIGSKKFAYDIWGDTVNIAARMESSGAPGRINISAATWDEVRDHFVCEPRGKLAVKNAGEVDMYFVTGPRTLV